MKTITKVSSKGQVVIPKDVRDALDWPEGTFLEVVRNPSNVTLSARNVDRPKFDQKAWRAEMRKIVQYSGPRSDDADWKESIDAIFREGKDVTV